jgi:SAM-dependent methyltransferase
MHTHGSQSASETPVFHRDRPGNIRRATARHPYAHHIRTLPRGLQTLAPELRVPPGGRVLDYGCAEVPYRSFFPADVDFVGADLPGNPDASLDLNLDGTLPIEDSSFDAVLSTQVLEHVEDPGRYLRECFRVLRPQRRMLLSTHGVFAYHPDPDDYWRWTCAGLQRAVREAGFEIVRFEGIIGSAATGLQLIEDAIYPRVPGRRLRGIVALVFNALMALADRIENDSSRRLNACVFALVATKP